ncbi:WD40 repeat domain-containing protein [Flavobacterium amniphilum]|uniref:WD40 repeat domain-containing protein n=1 Tax=Flavobacterium amniphilum TaxID=1834035 RepID=UPI00202A5611|nr:WD40 repeat domain-containing protein [Flavobacterium amniphilum]MCL9806664.1 WD40 repeat domain-containing protein [Flavobacterium amniphilum]
MYLTKDNVRNKRIRLLTVILLAIGSFLAYYQIFHKSKEVNSAIFKLQKVFSAHTSDVWAVKFSPNDAWLASGSVDGTVKIWNKENGALIRDLKHPIGVTSVAFAPNGDLLATCAYDAKIRLWKLPEGKLLKEFSGHNGTVWSIDFSSDSKTLVSSGEDKTIKLWDVESGKLLRTLIGHSLTVWDVKFSPDGAKIASGSYDKTIKIWDAKSGKLLNNLTGHTEAVVSLAFSPDNKLLVSTSDDKTLKLWNTTTWKLIKTIEVPEHIQASDFSPDSTRLLTGGRDKPAIGEFLQNFFGDSDYNKGVSMRLWDVKNGKLLQTFSQHANDVNDVSYSSDGKWIAGSSSDKTITLWKLSY